MPTKTKQINNKLNPDNHSNNLLDKQKRLAEINHQLELIHQEQQKLLQEVAKLMSDS